MHVYNCYQIEPIYPHHILGFRQPLWVLPGQSHDTPAGFLFRQQVKLCLHLSLCHRTLHLRNNWFCFRTNLRITETRESHQRFNHHLVYLSIHHSVPLLTRESYFKVKVVALRKLLSSDNLTNAGFTRLLLQIQMYQTCQVLFFVCKLPNALIELIMVDKV